MQRDAISYLWDVEQAAAATVRFVKGLDEEGYSDSEVVRSAVERKFEIIGEALGKPAKIEPDLIQRIPRHREIIAFRNLLIHGYAAVDNERVWRILQDSLPTLRSAVAVLLKDIARPAG